MSTTELSKDAEQQLNANLRKCRFCFRMIIDDRKAIDISEEIRLHFNSLTQLQLLDSEIFSNRICQMCEGDIKVFINFQSDMVEKQKALYELAGLHETHYSNKQHLQFEADDEYFETQSLLMNETEGIEVEEILEDETADPFDTMDFDETYEHSNQGETSQNEEIDESTRMSMRIEKLEEYSYGVDDDKEYELLEEEFVDGDQTEIAEAANFANLVVCQPCQIEVPKNQMEIHVKLLHKPCACQQCGNKFDTRIACRRHIIRQHMSSAHDGKSKRPRKHFCHLCVKEYENRRQLEDHVRSFHEKERNAECKICLKKFFYRDLKKHMEHVHGDKNIQCEYCEKKYTCIENLRLHMRYHNEPKFKCNQPGCNKKFHQKILLEHHMLKHSAEKPFCCENCPQNFFSLRDLKRHNERVHNKVMRRCPLCPAEFGRKDKLRLHVMKKHKDLENDEREAILEQVKVMRWNEIS